MGLGNFLPLGLMCFGCLSRLHFLSQHYLVSLVESYSLCYEQAKIPVGYRQLKNFPLVLALPKFQGGASKYVPPCHDPSTPHFLTTLHFKTGLRKQTQLPVTKILEVRSFLFSSLFFVLFETNFFFLSSQSSWEVGKWANTAWKNFPVKLS